VSEPKPLFVDTNAFIAVFDQDDTYHDRATAVIDGIEDGRLQYGPIFTGGQGESPGLDPCLLPTSLGSSARVIVASRKAKESGRITS
jgi:hypothetical protein